MPHSIASQTLNFELGRALVARNPINIFPEVVLSNSMTGDFNARVLLQDCETLLYLRGPGEWTFDANMALDFSHVRQAHEFALKTRQFNLDIVMTFGEPRYDVRLRASLEQSVPKLKPAS